MPGANARTMPVERAINGHALLLQGEERHGVVARPAALGVPLACPVPAGVPIEPGLQVAVNVAWRKESFRRVGNRLVAAAGLGRAKWGMIRASVTSRRSNSTGPHRQSERISVPCARRRGDEHSDRADSVP